jgi:uncharacterized membrane protein
MSRRSYSCELHVTPVDFSNQTRPTIQLPMMMPRTEFEIGFVIALALIIRDGSEDQANSRGGRWGMIAARD